jgi:transposase
MVGKAASRPGMKTAQEFSQVMLHRDPIDFRKGIFSLAAYVQNILQEDVFNSQQLFVFSNKSKSAVKILYWDKTGFAMWSKALEKQRFCWPKLPFENAVAVSPEELNWLLSGIDIFKLKRHIEVKLSRTA